MIGNDPDRSELSTLTVEQKRTFMQFKEHMPRDS